LELKILQHSTFSLSLRGGELSEVHRVSKQLWRYVRKFSGGLVLNPGLLEAYSIG